MDDTAPYRTEFYGKTFYFAHAECLNQFRAKPESYVKVKVNVNVKMNPEEQPAQEDPVPEATAGGEEPVPSDDATVTDQTPPEPPSEPDSPVAVPPAAVEPQNDPVVPQPNPDGSVWKDASGNPTPQDNGSEPGWLPPDPNSAPPAQEQSVPDDNAAPGWVPGAEPTIDSQPVPR